jgi:hypothetical protein
MRLPLMQFRPCLFAVPRLLWNGRPEQKLTFQDADTIEENDVAPERSVDPKQDLTKYLGEFKDARKELARALEREKKIEGLAEKLGTKMPELQARALEGWPEPVGPGIDAGRLNRLVHDTPEQKEIERIRQQRGDTEWKIQELRARVRRHWMRLALRNPTAATALREFDRLPPYSALSNVDTIIVLLEEALRSINPARRRSQDGRIIEVKGRIREMKEAKMSGKEICDRLGDAPRPLRAVWRDLPWPEAWKHHQGSVAKWISLV